MHKILLTGASGFLGKHITKQLLAQSFAVATLGRQPEANIRCDLSTEVPVLIDTFSLVIHAAGKAHSVPQTPAQEEEFFKVNLHGTKHLCKAFDNGGYWPEAFVFISTVAVYGLEEGELISEDHPLNGQTPYAKSKIEAERFLEAWCVEHSVKLSILRLPLIAGPNPPGNLGAMVNGIRNNRYFNIGEGDAKKSVVMADDVAKWIPVIAKKGGTYNLTDGHHPSFSELADIIAKQEGKSPVRSIPHWLALPIALAGNFLGPKAPLNSDKLNKITATLTFDDNKARKAFGWDPVPVSENFSIN